MQKNLGLPLSIDVLNPCSCYAVDDLTRQSGPDDGVTKLTDLQQTICELCRIALCKEHTPGDCEMQCASALSLLARRWHRANISLSNDRGVHYDIRIRVSETLTLRYGEGALTAVDRGTGLRAELAHI